MSLLELYFIFKMNTIDTNQRVVDINAPALSATDLSVDSTPSKTECRHSTSGVSDIENIISSKQQDVISCSRRTDIPAFYLDEYLQHFKDGFVDVPNPRYKRVYTVPLKSKCVIWWSKDYGKWIQRYIKNKEDFNFTKLHQFHFTINSGKRSEFENKQLSLEGGLTSTLEERLNQAKFLCETFGSENVFWRFDPIVHFKLRNDDEVYDNLKEFEKICKFMAGISIRKVIFSFCVPYRKTISRMKKQGKELVVISDEKKVDVIIQMYSVASKVGIKLQSCSVVLKDEKQQQEFNKYVNVGGCVDPQLITEQLEDYLQPMKITKRKDTGQRDECRCSLSRDIGDYSLKCKHSCSYCYANPM